MEQRDTDREKLFFAFFCCFSKSTKYDFSENGETRIVEVINSDQTGTNEYSIIRITRDTAEKCEEEFDGQLSDGVFENSRVGWFEEI